MLSRINPYECNGSVEILSEQPAPGQQTHSAPEDVPAGQRLRIADDGQANDFQQSARLLTTGGFVAQDFEQFVVDPGQGRLMVRIAHDPDQMTPRPAAEEFTVFEKQVANLGDGIDLAVLTACRSEAPTNPHGLTTEIVVDHVPDHRIQAVLIPEVLVTGKRRTSNGNRGSPSGLASTEHSAQPISDRAHDQGEKKQGSVYSDATEEDKEYVLQNALDGSSDRHEERKHQERPQENAAAHCGIT